MALNAVGFKVNHSNFNNTFHRFKVKDVIKIEDKVLSRSYDAGKHKMAGVPEKKTV